MMMTMGSSCGSTTLRHTPAAARRQAGGFGKGRCGVNGGVGAAAGRGVAAVAQPLKLGGGVVVGRRCAVAVRAAVGEEKETGAGSSSPAKSTLSGLDSILGVDTEAVAAAAKAAEDKIERELSAAKREQEAARAAALASSTPGAPKVVNRAATSAPTEDGDYNPAQRGLAALSYLLPLLDGLKYSKFLLLQFPLFGLALLPLKPAIDLWYGLGFLQIFAFFALYLGVVQNQSMDRFVRYNAQQAILLDILLIVPDVLTRAFAGLGAGDDAMLTGGPGLEAQVLLFNTVFIYVYLSSVVGAGACALGKTIKLPIVGDAADTQTRQ